MKSPKPSLLQQAGLAALGFVAALIPLHRKLRRESSQTPDFLQAQGWPIRLAQVLFTRYVLPWIDIQGLENLPSGSFIVAANHAYKSGVDGFILGHILATHAHCVPRILMTSDSRNWMVGLERWVLHHYGIALLVPDYKADPEAAKHRGGVSDLIANYLRETSRHAVLIFPAGRAIADPARQLENWSTGAVVAAEKSGRPVVPVAVGGLRLDWSPETVIFAALEAGENERPFHFHVRIGRPIAPTLDPHADLESLRVAVSNLMDEVPGLRAGPGEADPAFGKMTLRDGRTLAWMDRGPRDGTPILYLHGFQGSRLEHVPGIDAILANLNVRLISPDRPGIGLSTPSHARTVLGWADDVRQLTEHLLGPNAEFSIFGFSAGATYALACGQLPGLKAMALVGGMGLPHLIASWRRYSEEAWHILLSAKLANVRQKTFLRIEKQNHDQIFERWEPYFDGVKKSLSPDDQRILSKPEVEELIRESRREGYSQGSSCLLQETQALYSNPRIDVAHLSPCRVLIFHGDEDLVVPVPVARDLHHRIPGSELQEFTGRGHYFIYDDGQMELLLSRLLEAHRQCA